MEPLALYPNLFTIEPFGLVNFHTIETYHSIIQSNIEFIKANIDLIIKGKSWLKTNDALRTGVFEIAINSNAVYKCFYEYYLPQFENNKEIWNIETFGK